MDGVIAWAETNKDKEFSERTERWVKSKRSFKNIFAIVAIDKAQDGSDVCMGLIFGKPVPLIQPLQFEVSYVLRDQSKDGTPQGTKGLGETLIKKFGGYLKSKMRYSALSLSPANAEVMKFYTRIGFKTGATSMILK